NTSGKLVPFGSIEKDVDYPIATDYGNWWRIVFADRVGYVRKSEVHIESEVTFKKYNISLQEAVNIQMKANPQTDKKQYAYVSKAYIDENNRVTANALYVRTGPGTNYKSIGTLPKGTKVTILEEVNGWYAIQYNNS